MPIVLTIAAQQFVEVTMAVINRMAELHDEITAWRRKYHANPELMYEVHETAGDVAEKLKVFGCDEIVTGIGRTGVVGVIKGNGNGDRVIGLRADMDALPIDGNHRTSTCFQKQRQDACLRP